MKKRKSIGSTPLTRWLLDYVDVHKTNLSELVLQAGLSAGSLHSLITYPERVQTLETCLRLSMVTGKSVDELFQMAGLDGYEPMENLDPDRLELLRSYKELPRQMRHTLCLIAQALKESLSHEEYRETLLGLFGYPLPTTRKHLVDVVLATAGEINDQNMH